MSDEELRRIEQEVKLNGFARLSGGSNIPDLPCYQIVPTSTEGLSNFAKRNVYWLHKGAIQILEMRGVMPSGGYDKKE